MAQQSFSIFSLVHGFAASIGSDMSETLAGFMDASPNKTNKIVPRLHRYLVAASIPSLQRIIGALDASKISNF